MRDKRSRRVADLLREEIAVVLQRKVKDPRLMDVTITGVEMSSDLRYAKVFYCFSGNRKRGPDVAAGMEKAKGFIRNELGRRIRLKYLPELRFCYDSSLDRAAEIELLLKKLKQDERI